MSESNATTPDAENPPDVYLLAPRESQAPAVDEPVVGSPLVGEPVVEPVAADAPAVEQDALAGPGNELLAHSRPRDAMPPAPLSRCALAAALLALLSPAALGLFYLAIPLWLSFVLAFTAPLCAIGCGAAALWQIRVRGRWLRGNYLALGAVLVGISMGIILTMLQQEIHRQWQRQDSRHYYLPMKLMQPASRPVH